MNDYERALPDANGAEATPEKAFEAHRAKVADPYTTSYPSFLAGWNAALTPITVEQQTPRTVPGGYQQDLIDWACERWHAEVANRPMINVHRRSLDGTWRQVLRHLGVDDRARLGPTHDDLRAEISTTEWERMNGKPIPPTPSPL